jgi:CheY-like chemotaxis protein
MAQEIPPRIAVIVEDQRLQDYIVMLLVGEGYEVKAFSTQVEAFSGLEKNLADLIISEFQSPHINGLDICKVLRKNFFFNSVPMLFLIPDSEPLNVARLIYAGADDYIKKSLIQDELFLKVKLNLYRLTRQQRDVNPLTRLPGKSALLQELHKRIEIKENFAVYSASVMPLEEFSYRYGFATATAVVKFTASVFIKAMQSLGDPSDFLCHSEMGEFFLLTLPDNVDGIATSIIQGFDKGIASFYDEEDKQRGYSLYKNRSGEMQKLPFLRVSMGVATNDYFPLFPPFRIIQIASEIKRLAQKVDKSIFVKEERKNYPLT